MDFHKIVRKISQIDEICSGSTNYIGDLVPSENGASIVQESDENESVNRNLPMDQDPAPNGSDENSDAILAGSSSVKKLWTLSYNLCPHHVLEEMTGVASPSLSNYEERLQNK